MNQTGEFASERGLQAVSEWPSTKERIRLAQNSLNIAAAIRPISEEKVHNIPLLLKHSEPTLPGLDGRAHCDGAADMGRSDLNPSSDPKDKNAGSKRKGRSSFEQAETKPAKAKKNRPSVLSSHDPRGVHSARPTGRGGKTGVKVEAASSRSSRHGWVCVSWSPFSDRVVVSVW